MYFRRKRNAVVPVASMADIAFLLLIFLMVTSAMDFDKELQIKLPVLKRTETLPGSGTFRIWIKDGEYFVKGKRISIPKLSNQMVLMRLARPDLKLVISGNKNIKFEDFYTVINLAKKNKIKELVISTAKGERRYDFK